MLVIIFVFKFMRLANSVDFHDYTGLIKGSVLGSETNYVYYTPMTELIVVKFVL